MHNNLNYSVIEGKGLCIRASVNLFEGETIDRAPAKECSAAVRDFLSITELGTMMFADPATYDPTRGAPNVCREVYGAISFAAHSSEPNAVVEWWEEGGQLWARLKALRNISANEEVTIAYTDIMSELYSDRDSWAA